MNTGRVGNIAGASLLLAAASAIVVASPANAQFGGLLNSLKHKAEDAVVTSVDQPETKDQGTDRTSPRIAVHHGFDFTPGSTVLFSDNFAGNKLGAMPPEWKTNGSGEIVTADGLPGNWLALQSFASYKLSQPPRLPENFTIEFDVIPVADKARDAGRVIFGFARDDSTRGYISDAYNGGALTGVTVNFEGDTTIASSATGYYHALSLDLAGYANQVMHFSIAVEGNQEQVYLDHQKIGDAKVFTHNPGRYFYISGPVRMDHGAQLLFGNFRLATSATADSGRS